MLITLYWIGFVFLPLFPFLIPHYPDMLGDILGKINLTENLHPIVEIVVFVLPIFGAIALPADLWCLLRYRKDRVVAINRHYRQSIWKDAVSMWLLWIIPILFDLLLLVIYVTMIK